MGVRPKTAPTSIDCFSRDADPATSNFKFEGSQCTHISGDKKRVQFRAPSRLIDRADSLAAVFGSDRTDVLITALREYLRDAAHDDELKQEIAGAYYDDEITFEQLKSLVGKEEAANFQVLKQQLDKSLTEELAEL